MRGVAGFPRLLPLPGAAGERFQPIALDDLAGGLAQLLAEDGPTRVTLYAAGPETVSVRDILIAYRAWLGFPKAREIVVPLPLMRLLLRLGDLAGLFGYPTSLRTTSLAQMGHDRLVDGTAFAKACTAPLKSFHDTLTRKSGHLAGPPACAELFRPAAVAGDAGALLDRHRRRHPDAAELCWRHVPGGSGRFQPVAGLGAGRRVGH